MNIEEMKRSKKEHLSPQDVAEVLRSNPQSVRVQARQRPELLGFPVTVVGNRVKIPRRAFLKYITGEVADT